MPGVYWAHTKKGPQDGWERLEQHLAEVETLAGEFAAGFGAKEWGRIAGRYHDIGKFSDAFQDYLSRAGDPHVGDLTGNGMRVDHSTAGAQLAAESFGDWGRLMSYVIAGHHAGLADWDGGNGGVLRERLERRVESWQDAAASWLKNERLPQPNFRVAPTTETCSFKVSLFARMIFSCLVDADFLCTEAFMSPDRAKRRALSPPTLGQLAGSLRGHLKDLSIGGRGSVHDLRQHVLNLCRQAAPQSPGVFTLCVPTGGGKTLSSMQFALNHAVTHEKVRVIIAMPFTSIVEQNADVYRGAFGDVPAGTVLEHHSNLAAEHATTRTRLLAENWDAPIVVTTNVQLLESLFTNREVAVASCTASQIV